jgi:hypothetical protein
MIAAAQRGIYCYGSGKIRGVGVPVDCKWQRFLWGVAEKDAYCMHRRPEETHYNRNFEARDAFYHPTALEPGYMHSVRLDKFGGGTAAEQFFKTV